MSQTTRLFEANFAYIYFYFPLSMGDCFTASGGLMR